MYDTKYIDSIWNIKGNDAIIYSLLFAFVSFFTYLSFYFFMCSLHFAFLLHLNFPFLLLLLYYFLLNYIPSLPALVWLILFPFSSLTFQFPFVFIYVIFLLSLPVYLSFFTGWRTLLFLNFCTMLRYPTWPASVVHDLRHLLVIKIISSSIYDTYVEDRPR